jgi:diaminohydroxyphosphoribosylaminopyrimidine deaminase/5-amino-6-(5-phosphoribosylamino)uracil reductase
VLSTDDRRYLERALELAERGRGTTAPNPIVGAVVVSPAGDVVGEGWHERKGLPHGEAIALQQAGPRAEGGTLYVTLEPCAHQGSTPPCAEAVVAAGVRRVVAAVGDPNPRTDGKGFERLRGAGIEVELSGGELEWRARVQNEAFRVWVTRGRPFVIYKAAITLDGRMAVPGARWVSGEAARRLVHELRASVHAVGVGMGTVLADKPLLTARDVKVERQPRRLAFGRGPLPEGCELELRSGPLEDELAALAADGVQSLLLEGGPRIASAFLEAELVDKLLVFVAPTLAGAGPGLLEALHAPVTLSHLDARPVGDDVLLTAYVHEP